MVWIYPPAGVVPPAKQRIHRGEATAAFTAGKITHATYILEDPWELPPGEWTLQLWYGNRRLAQQRFNVIAP